MIVWNDSLVNKVLRFTRIARFVVFVNQKQTKEKKKWKEKNDYDGIRTYDEKFCSLS